MEDIMSNKTGLLISEFLAIHKQMNTVYKNIRKIDGQYNLRLETIATILDQQSKNRFDVYSKILNSASEQDVDITDEGYEEALEILRAYKTKMIDTSMTQKKNIVNLALEFTNLNIVIFNNILDLIVQYEVEKDITHGPMKENIEMLLKLEERDVKTLLSFKKK